MRQFFFVVVAVAALMAGGCQGCHEVVTNERLDSVERPPQIEHFSDKFFVVSSQHDVPGGLQRVVLGRIVRDDPVLHYCAGLAPSSEIFEPGSGLEVQVVRVTFARGEEGFTEVYLVQPKPK